MSSRVPDHFVSRCAAAALALVVGAVVSLPALAQVRYVAPSIPADLGGSTHLPSELLRTSGSTYAPDLSLPSGVRIAAAHKERDGDWLLVVAEPATLGSVEATPRDVVRCEDGLYTLEHSGDALGLPADAAIDALYRGLDGRLRFSFSAPVELSGTVHSRSDLLVYDGVAFSVDWDADSGGIPLYANLSGAGIDPAGNVVVSFDVPTEISGTDYLPGELVQVTGEAQSYALDATWPLSAQISALSLMPTAPPVPSGAPGEGTALSVVKAAAGALTLTWDAPCGGTDEMDYSVYEGAIGRWADLASHACSTGGALTIDLVPGAGARFFLVTANNGDAESSYGLRSDGSERPLPAAACYESAPGSCYDPIPSYERAGRSGGFHR